MVTTQEALRLARVRADLSMLGCRQPHEAIARIQTAVRDRLMTFEQAIAAEVEAITAAGARLDG